MYIDVLESLHQYLFAMKIFNFTFCHENEPFEVNINKQCLLIVVRDFTITADQDQNLRKNIGTKAHSNETVQLHVVLIST